MTAVCARDGADGGILPARKLSDDAPLVNTKRIGQTNTMTSVCLALKTPLRARSVLECRINKKTHILFESKALCEVHEIAFALSREPTIDARHGGEMMMMM